MERRLAAILSMDVAGYARLMGRDEAGTLTALKAHRAELINPKAAPYGGKTIKLMGDGALMEFASAVGAVRFAVEVQCAMDKRNAGIAEDQRIEFRIGINIGDVIAEDGDIHGDGVNVAARLEGLAEPGGICVRRNVRNQVRDKLDLDFDDLGDVEVKNIERPIRAFHITLNEKAEALGALPAEPPPEEHRKKPSRLLQGAVGIVLSLALIGGLAWWQPWAPDVEPASVEKMAYPLPDKPSIAVLPFANLGGDPEQEYFADGFTENVITELSRFRNLFVIARNSTFTYKGRVVRVQEVSEELGVQYVLEGSVRRSADRIRITAQLVDAITGRHLWAERYDRDMDDLFTLQDEVSRHIVATLAAEGGLLADAWQKRTVRAGTDSLKAYDLDLRGWAAIMPWTKEAFDRGEELFEQAIAADPDYARPYAKLALSLAWQYSAKTTSEESLDRAVGLAKEAIARDDGEAWGHWALGAAYLALGRHDEAVAAYEKALALNPNDADVLAETSFLFAWVGRMEEGIENVKTAMRLNPRYDDWYLWGLGVAYYDARRYRAAAETLASRKTPNLKSNLYLAAAYGQLGREAEARKVVEMILAENRDSSIALWGEAQPYQNEADQAHYIEGLRKAGLPEEPPLALPAKPSIAVLAFDDLSAGADKDYLSDAIAEGIITNLSHFSELFVIAGNSSLYYKGKATDVREIARDLGVRYLLEGSQQKAGDRLRVTVQLIDADEGNHIWAETYDRDLVDLFVVQDQIADSVASTVGAKVVVAAGEVAKKGNSEQLRAFEYWLKGTRHWYEWTEEGNEKARELYLKAIEADPSLPRGHLGIAWVYINGFRWGWTELDRDEALARARALAQTALDLAPDDYFPHHTMAVVLTQAAERERAIAEFEKALALNPNAANVMMDLAEVLVYSGRMQGAIDWMHRAMRLDPHHADWFYWNLGWAQYFAGDCEEALATMRKMSSMPALANRTVAAAHVCLGQTDEAQAAVAALLEHDPDYSVAKLRLNFEGKYTNPADLERFIDDLRRAGLAE